VSWTKTTTKAAGFYANQNIASKASESLSVRIKVVRRVIESGQSEWWGSPSASSEAKMQLHEHRMQSGRRTFVVPTVDHCDRKHAARSSSSSTSFSSSAPASTAIGCMCCRTATDVPVAVFVFGVRYHSSEQLRVQADEISKTLADWIGQPRRVAPLSGISGVALSKKPSASPAAAAAAAPTDCKKHHEHHRRVRQRDDEGDGAGGLKKLAQAADSRALPLAMVQMMVLDLFLLSFKRVIEMLKFDGAEIWIESVPGSELLVHGSTITKLQQHIGWANANASLRFSAEHRSSMVGRVLSSRSPEWQSNVCALPESKFVRLHAAQKHGVRGVVGIYCRTRQGLQFVVVLFSREAVAFTKSRECNILKTVKAWTKGTVSAAPVRILAAAAR